MIQDVCGPDVGFAFIVQAEWPLIAGNGEVHDEILDDIGLVAIWHQLVVS